MPISSIEFILSMEVISTTIGIPNIGETWLKKRDIDLQSYKMYLKPPYKTTPKHVFPFRYLLDRYAPLMRLIMKYFTCEVGIQGGISTT